MKQDTNSYTEQLPNVSGLSVEIAHEIKNPLIRIKGFIQLLQASTDMNRKKAYYKIIMDEVIKLESIRSELLNTQKSAADDKQT